MFIVVAFVVVWSRPIRSRAKWSRAIRSGAEIAGAIGRRWRWVARKNEGRRRVVVVNFSVVEMVNGRWAVVEAAASETAAPESAAPKSTVSYSANKTLEFVEQPFVRGHVQVNQRLDNFFSELVFGDLD